MSTEQRIAELEAMKAALRRRNPHLFAELEATKAALGQESNDRIDREMEAASRLAGTMASTRLLDHFERQATEARAERDALAAHCARLRETLEKCRSLAQSSLDLTTCLKGQWDHEISVVAIAALASTPAQSLESIRAEAKSEALKMMAGIVAKLVPELRDYIRESYSGPGCDVESLVQGALCRLLARRRSPG